MYPFNYVMNNLGFRITKQICVTTVMLITCYDDIWDITKMESSIIDFFSRSRSLNKEFIECFEWVDQFALGVF